MSENSTEGVYYYTGNLPLPGAYANMKDGKEYPCIFAAGIIISIMIAMILILI